MYQSFKVHVNGGSVEVRTKDLRCDWRRMIAPTDEFLELQGVVEKRSVALLLQAMRAEKRAAPRVAAVFALRGRRLGLRCHPSRCDMSRRVGWERRCKHKMLDHINLLRHLVLTFGGLVFLWFLWMFLCFYATDRQRHRHRR